MWQSKIEILDHRRARRFEILRDDARISYAEVIDGWRKDPEFRDFYISLLADAPYQALFWESPPVSRYSVEQPYEFALINSPQLATATPDSSPFGSSFKSAVSSTSVLTLENLNRDAVLIVPCPLAGHAVYTHLAAFVRDAPAAQCHELFQKLGDELHSRLDEKPVWVSTSGLDVFWLHIRLDSRPKYYNFQPYRAPSGYR
jgi:hypothetical protein